jgi:biopolymer transport protein ExbD
MAVGAAQEGEPIVDINTTPLIDVMLVLLIMLIVTLPPRRDNVQLNMPPPNPPPQTETPEEINIYVNEDGSMTWGDAPVQLAELDGRMATARDSAKSAGRPEPQIMVIPQRLARYRYVAAVMAAAQRARLEKLGVRNPA